MKKNTNTSVLINNKHANSLRLKPPSTINTILQLHDNQFTLKNGPSLWDAKALDLIKFCKIDPKMKAFLDLLNK